MKPDSYSIKGEFSFCLLTKHNKYVLNVIFTPQNGKKFDRYQFAIIPNILNVQMQRIPGVILINPRLGMIISR